MALTVTGMGGLAMIGGMLILGQIAGSYDLSVILQNRDLIQADPLYVPALILILLGLFHKICAVPVPLLAAARHGRAHARVGLSALGDDGEGGHFPDGAHVAGAVWHA